jgi:hypothetical protein
MVGMISLKILRSPKYLQFAVNTIGVSGFQVEDLSLIDFKSKLWSHIIEKSTIAGSGMARKRGKAFSNVAIKSLNFFERLQSINY